MANCPVTINDPVCVEAEITITPSVIVGSIETFCLGNPSFGGCPGELVTECIFRVSQSICVQVPLTFSANAVAEPVGISCGSPDTGACAIPGCTYTIGFFANHQDVTNALITAAGGSVLLGNGGGLSLSATTSNANAILLGNAPSPPTPGSPPLMGQYQSLYAQLLAANLNVLNGATCPFAQSAISNANAFITSSPAGGTTGAPGFQTPLEQFNSGNAPGCPFHCPED